MKYFCVITCYVNIFLLLFLLEIVGAEKDIIKLGKKYNSNGEYYNSITEMMRYQHLYPNGKYYPNSMLILGEAFLKGGNYYKTISALTMCYEKYRNTLEGEKALYSLGYVRMIMGSPYFAYRAYQEYQYIYKNGSFKEDLTRDLCYTYILMKDLKKAKRKIEEYELNYKNGKYLKEMEETRVIIDEEINRPKKNMWVSVLGSIALPGFGHFYTGKYDVGIFSFVSNIILIYLTYDGYRDNDKFRMIMFGLAEFSFYQYSLYSSISNVYEYNNHAKFYNNIRLKASTKF